MVAPELIWDPGKSNWRPHQRRFARPLVEQALGRAIEGLEIFGIEMEVERLTLYRGVNTNKAYGTTDLDRPFVGLYMRADDLHHRKLANKVNFLAQTIFHELIHGARLRYSQDYTIAERAATEGEAYSFTQKFAEEMGMEDEFDEPVHFLRTLPSADLLALRADVLAAHRKLGIVSLTDRIKGPEFDYWALLPDVGQYSATDVVGICAVADHLDRGEKPADLISVPAEELIWAA